MNAQVRNAVVATLTRDATTEDGTAIPAQIKVAAVAALQAAWDAHKTAVSVSGMILAIAKDCVSAAEGDYTLALSMFNGALADAETEFRKAHKAKAEKSLVDDFFDTGSNWKQYTATIGSAIKEGYDVRKAKSESQLRKQRKDAKEAKNSVTKAKRALAADFDVSKVDETKLAEMVAEATDAKGVLDMEALKEAAEEAELPKAPVNEERIHTEATGIADKYIPGEGHDAARTALAIILKACRVINWDDVKTAERAVNLLNQTVVGLNKLVPETKAPIVKAQTKAEKLVEKNADEYSVAQA